MSARAQIVAILVVLLAAGILLFFSNSSPAKQELDTSLDSSKTVGINDPLAEGLAIFPAWDVFEPATFPMVVDGQASGPWYFEGSFPVEVRDPEGNVLGQGYTTAQDEWMTEDVVSFFAQIERSENATPYSGQAELVLMRANPSGLPEYDAEFTFPILVEVQ